MKRVLFGNKKMMTGVIAIMVGITILLAGLALAWFTSGGTDTGTINFGTIGVFATLDIPNNDLGAFQGYPVKDGFMNQIGWVESTGTLDALVEFNLSVIVDGWYVADPAGDVLGLEFVVEGVPGKAYPFGYWADFSSSNIADWGVYLWQMGTNGKTYLWTAGNDILHFGYNVLIDGANMGDNFQGTKVDFNLNWDAVQAMPNDAIIDFVADIVDYVDDPITGFSYYEDANGDEFFIDFEDATGNIIFIIYDGSNPLNPPISPFSVDTRTFEEKFEEFLGTIDNDYFRQQVAKVFG